MFGFPSLLGTSPPQDPLGRPAVHFALESIPILFLAGNRDQLLFLLLPLQFLEQCLELFSLFGIAQPLDELGPVHLTFSVAEGTAEVTSFVDSHGSS